MEGGTTKGEAEEVVVDHLEDVMEVEEVVEIVKEGRQAEEVVVDLEDVMEVEEVVEVVEEGRQAEEVVVDLEDVMEVEEGMLRHDLAINNAPNSSSYYTIRVLIRLDFLSVHIGYAYEQFYFIIATN